MRTLLCVAFIISTFAQNDFEKHVRTLTAKLKSPNDKEKIAALHSLGNLGEHAAPAVPMMIYVLKNAQMPVRQAAINALLRLGPTAKPASRELIKLLLLKHKNTVILVRKALIAIQDLPELLKNVNHTSFRVRSHILFILGEIKARDSRSFVVSKVDDSSWQVRYAALEALHKISGQQIDVEYVIKGLSDKHQVVQMLAIKICGNISLKEELVEKLLEVFKEQSSVNVRSDILDSFVKMNSTSPKLKEILSISLQDERLQTRAITLIGKTQNANLVKQIIPLLHKNTALKIAVIDCLGNFKNATELFIHELIAMTTDADKNVRMHAANSIGKLGEKVVMYVIPSLLSLLEDSNSEVQTHAAIALGKMGKKAVPILANIIKNNKYLRSHACYSLAQIGAHSVTTLIALLESENAAIRFYAAEALGRIEHPSVEKAIAKLIQLLQTEKDKQHFAEVLGKIGGNAAKPLIGLLAHGEWQVRKAAANALVIMGAACIPLLTQTIGHQNKYVQLYSISIVGRLKERSVIPTLIDVYQVSNDKEIQRSIIIAFGQINDTRTVPILKKALTSSLKEEALNAAIAMGKDAQEMTAELVQVMISASTEHRKMAARSLSSIGEAAVLPLEKALESQDRLARAFAVIALGNIGHDAAKAVPTLIAKLQSSEDVYFQENIMYALANIKGEIKMTMMALQQYLNSHNTKLKRTAIIAIGKMGKLGSVYIPKLLYETTQSKKELYNVTVTAIAEMGEESIPYIVPFLKNEEMYHRQIIAAALGKMGESAYKSLPSILEALENSGSEARKEMIRTIKNIGPKAAFAVPTLSVFVRHKDWQIRELSVQAIAMMGEKAQVAIPVLLPLLGDSSWPVRNAVSEALAKIGGEAAVIGLQAALKKPFPEMQIHALIALRGLETEAYSAVDDILHIIKSDTPSRIKSHAIYAIGKIAPRETRVRRELVSLLKEKNWQVRQAALFVLKDGRD